MHLHGGSRVDFDFDHVSADGDVFGRHQEHVRARDIEALERRPINKVRTSILVASLAVVAFAILVILTDDGFYVAPE